jgi:hypothetical protein
MSAVVALIAVALLAGLLGSVWLRRGDIEGNGESGSMLLGVIFCFIAVMLILVAAGKLWS